MLTEIQRILRENSTDNGSIGRDLVYIPELHVVFCFISKNASSFLKTYLIALAKGVTMPSKGRNPHVLANSGFASLLQMDAEAAQALLADNSVPKVVVGRDPMKRFESAYLSRVLTQQRETYDSHSRDSWVRLRQKVSGDRHQSHAAPAELAISDDITINEVAKYVDRTASGQLDQHFVPQTYFASTENISYTLRGKVEELDLFLDDFCELVGRNRLETPPPQLNKSPLANALEDLSRTQENLLRKRYRHDYEFFGYSNA